MWIDYICEKIPKKICNSYLATTVQRDVPWMLHGAMYIYVYSVNNGIVSQAQVTALVDANAEGQVDLGSLQVHFLW